MGLSSMVQWVYVISPSSSSRYEGATRGPMDRDWRHHEGCDPAGGKAGMYHRRLGNMLMLPPHNSTFLNILMYVSHCFLQALQQLPSRTLKGESGLKKTTNSRTVSLKSSRARLTRSILIV